MTYIGDDWYAHVSLAVAFHPETKGVAQPMLFSSRQRVIAATVAAMEKALRQERRRLNRNGRKFLRMEARRGNYYEQGPDGVLVRKVSDAEA